MKHELFHLLSSYIIQKYEKIKFRKKYKQEHINLYRSYLTMNSPCDMLKIYDNFAQNFNIEKKRHQYFWLCYMCLLIQNNKKEIALKLLKQYVKGKNKTKNIHFFLPVADLARHNNISNKRIDMASRVFQSLEKYRKEKIFEKTITSKSIAIVGNSPSELGKQKGTEIDSHDIVIRFNNYRLDGYEKDYGKRTDIWIRGFAGIDVQDKTLNQNYLFTGITGNYLFYPLYSENQLDILYRDLIETPILTGYISPELYLSLHDTFQGEPSTGLAVIFTCLNMPVKKIDLYGFSYLQESPDNYASHYFNDRDEKEARKSSVNHNFDVETQYLRSLFHDKR